MSMSLNNKVALVTGANRGIGRAIVDSFLNHGVKKVYLAVRKTESTKELEQLFGDKVVTLQADVKDVNSIQRLAEHATDVDIVVNNAGIMRFSSPLDDNAEQTLAEEIDVNTFGLMRVAKVFSKILENNKGALVQLNSIASLKTFGDISTYCASKAASYAITQGLREKFRDKGVTVLSVHPGPIATDMGTEAGFEGAPSATLVSEGIVKALENGDFHLFPDDMAKQFETAYQNFSDNIVTAELSV